MVRLLLALLFALLLPACVSLDAPITNQAPTLAAKLAPAGSKEAADLLSAAKNADGLVAIGVLAADDPVVTCAHGAVSAAGLDAPAAEVKSYTPELNGPLSEGVVLYARVKQAKQALGQPLKVPAGCGDLLLQIKIDLIHDARRLRLLP